MGQDHGDRLTAIDAAFLEMESPTQHMHVGGLFLFEPSAPGSFDFQKFLRLVRSRLHLVPRYRQKLAFMPLSLANPIWVDDEHFDLSYHVRHAALPRPGTLEQLTEFAARILSRPLDRDKPLWEVYVIEGLEDGRFAVLGKNHHAQIDGIAGMDIAQVMFDVSSEIPDQYPPPEPWEPEVAPTGYSLLWSGLQAALASPVASTVGRAQRAVRNPTTTIAKAARVGQGLVGVARSNLTRPAPKSLLNRAPGVSRRIAVQPIPLDEVKRVKNAFGSTVNDVVLAMVGDTVGRYLRGRGAKTDGVRLRVMVPVSVRTESGDGALGNQVTSVFVDLPVGPMDPIERLEYCSANMRNVKQSHHALGAEFLVGLTEFAPPTIHAMASRLAASSRLFNFVVTNVPGPQIPIYCLGARLRGAYPFIPLVATQAIAVGVTSIDGIMSFGFTADYDAVPDVNDLPALLRGSLDDLLASAGATEARKASPGEPNAPVPGDDTTELALQRPNERALPDPGSEAAGA